LVSLQRCIEAGHEKIAQKLFSALDFGMFPAQLLAVPSSQRYRNRLLTGQVSYSTDCVRKKWKRVWSERPNRICICKTDNYKPLATK